MHQRPTATSGLAIVALTLAACADAGPATTPRPSLPASSEDSSAGPSSTVEPTDLGAVVISADRPPTGMSSDGGRDGQILGRLPLSPSRASDFQGQSGFVTGSYSTFSGSAGFLLTWAAQYASEVEAANAVSIVIDDLQSDDGYGWGIGEDADLGDEGTCLEGDNPQEGGLHETICAWRNGPLVLVVGGDSSEATVQSLAEEMDSRADAVLSQ